MFDGRTILITGGTGTFGNAVVQRYLQTDISEIRIFSRDEKKQEDMRSELKDSRVKFFLGDVREPSSLIAPMTGVDYVFHAAALKQVPSCEFFPLDAIRTNTLGADNVFKTAADAGVKTVVALSTDKAVYPVGAMGMSKALMEKVLASRARNSAKTIFCGTRFGNLLASRGSVVPLFIKQILSGSPITITDPDMTRFVMTIEESVDLVVYAFEHGKTGDIFVKKDSSATILTIAWALKEIFKANNEIRVLGMRHGEKLHESLLTREERAKAEDCGDYYRIPLDVRDLNYLTEFDKGKECSVFNEYTSQNTHQMNLAEVVNLLTKLDCVQEALSKR